MINTFVATMFLIALFWVLPFLILIVVPSIVVPVLVSWVMNKKSRTIPSIGWYILFLILGGLIAYIFWIFCIRDVLYHEWNPGLLPPYSFFGRESIRLSGVGFNWIANGWKEWHIDLLWATLTLFVYAFAGFWAWLINRRSPQIKQYMRTVGISILILILVTMILPRLNLFPMQYINLFPGSVTTRFQENNIPCPKSTDSHPKILSYYNAENGEVITDLDGNNETVAFEKDVQLRGHHAIFSPDETKVIALQAGWREYWIMCIYSRGATKIEIPEYEANPHVSPRSIPSWSPDGTKLVVNLYGDLAIVDIATKKFEIVKNQVAFRNNHIDLTSKDRNIQIPAYETGTVYWSRDGLIYYSSFEGDKTTLHQYNLTDQSDRVIYTTDEEISIKSGDPTGRYLLMNIYRRNEDRSFGGFGRDVIFDTKSNKEVEQYEGDSIPHLVWSPSGKYFIQGKVKWPKDGEKASAAYVQASDQSSDIDISTMVEEYFSKKGKSFVKGSLVVEAVDFVDEDQLLARVTFPYEVYDHRYASSNVIINFLTREIKLFEAYAHGQSTGQELRPLKILHP